MIQRALRQFSGDGLRAQLLRGGAGSLLIKAGHALLAFSVAVVLARVLGPEGYGIYSYALAILMITAIPAQVGIPQLIVRETAKAQANEDWRLMRGLWRWGNLAVFGFSTVGVLAAGGVLLLMNSPEGGRNGTVAVGLALIPLIALSNVRAACLRGLRRVVWGQFPESIIRPGLVLILVSSGMTVLGAGFASTPRSVMGLHVAAAVITFVVGWFMLCKARPDEMKQSFRPRYEASGWQKAVIPLAMIMGLQLVNNYADLIILGGLRTDEEVGVYRAVFEISLLTVFGLKAIEQVLQPFFSRYYAIEGSEGENFKKLIVVSARVIFLLAVPPAVIMIVFGRPLLGFLFGAEYQIGYIALAILASGQLVNAGMGSVGMLLNMTGHERDTVRGIAIAAISNVVLNFILIPTFGMAGAASATAVSLFIWNIILRSLVRDRLKVESSILGERILRSDIFKS